MISHGFPEWVGSPPRNPVLAFDFDKTLVSTGAKIRVLRNGELLSFTQEEYTPQKRVWGDKPDWVDFEHNFDGAVIMPHMALLRRGVAALGIDRVAIVTARKHPRPVRDFLMQHHVPMPRVYCLNDERPPAKCAWLRNEITNHDRDYVVFWDDRKYYIDAIEELSCEFPHVRIFTNWVTPDGDRQKDESQEE